MKLLTIAYTLPPLIFPQSIQIGRWLYYLPQTYKLFVVTADEKGCLRDEKFYHDIHSKFADCIKIPFSYTFFIRIVRRLLRIPDEFLFWQIKAYKNIIKKWENEKFDCILTFSHPLSSNLVGLWLKKFFKTSWIAFFSDPWVDSPYSNYKHIIKKINTFLEKKVFAHADIFVFPSQEMENMYLKKYPFIKSFNLPHSFDPNLYSNIEPKKRDRLVLRYIGNIYIGRTPESLITAIRNLVDKKILDKNNFLFEIVGSLEKKYRNIKKDSIEGTVIFREPVSYLESLNLMEEADVLVVIDGNIKDSVFLPSKLIDYIGANRPIFGITPLSSPSARVISKIGGWVVGPDNISGIEKILCEILTHYKNGTLERFKPKEAREEFSIYKNINNFVNIIRKYEILKPN